MKVPARLERMGDYLEAKAGRRTFSFDFIRARILELE